MSDIYLFDSIIKEKTKFNSLKPNKARIYVCGPTVYDDSHLGHAKSAISFDLLHRTLLFNGYDVLMAKNFTDIDDKIIKKMNETGQSLSEVTNFYINRYKEDMKNLNVLDNTVEPKATTNIDSMKEMIENLIDRDIAYKTSDGVYFDTSKDKLYGNLYNLVSEDSKSRVEENKEKRTQKDFALWKFEKEKDVVYESSFGNGRPGWHLECSAVISKQVAYTDTEYQIDIHAGGADLKFPHHENEATQSRMHSGRELAKYWMHNGFITINGDKMSKSLGNSFFLRDVLKYYSGEVIRFYLISSSYRANIDFNEIDLLASKKRLDRLYRLKKDIYGVKYKVEYKDIKDMFLSIMNDDLNSAKFISVVDELVTEYSKKLEDNSKDKELKRKVSYFFYVIDSLIGIGGSDAFEYFLYGIDSIERKEIEILIEKRNSYRKEKKYDLSDLIREELKSKFDVTIMDTSNGVVWEKG